MSVLISLADESDLDGLTRMEGLIQDGWTAEMVQESISNGRSRFIKAESDGHILGYINFSVTLDEAEINGIAVEERSRGNGVAARLIGYLLGICKNENIGCIFLEVNENNAVAIGFYEKCGFEFLYERKKYYKNNESALIYKLIV